MLKAKTKTETQEIMKLYEQKYDRVDTPDLYGRFLWDCGYRYVEGFKSPSLSKSSLGDFCYEVMMHDGLVMSLWNQYGKLHRSAVIARVRMTMEDKEEFEKKTKYALTPIPVVSFN